MGKEKDVISEVNLASPREAWDSSLKDKATAAVAGEAEAERLLHELRLHQVELEELRRAKAEIETRLEKYTDLYETAPVGYFILDDRGLIIQANLTGAALLGLERAQLGGRSLVSLMSPGSHATFQNFLAGLSDSSGPMSCEVRHKLGKSMPRQLHIQGTYCPGEEDGAGRYRLTAADISQRKQAEEALRQAAQNQQTLLRCLPVGVLMVDDQHRITELNTQGELITGYGKHEVLGKECRVLFQEDQCRLQCPLDTALASGQATSATDLIVVTKQNVSIPVRAQAALVLGPRGRRVGAVMTFQDIRPFQALERERQNIASLFAHDVKSPLVNILGFAQLLSQNHGGLTPAKREKFGAIIREEGSRLEALIDDFLEFSRLASGNMILNYKPTDLTKLLLDTVKAFGAQAKQAGIRLETKNLATLPIIKADHPRLRRVFANLLENALKYSPAGTTVSLEAAQTQNRVMVTVRDQGQGMDPAELPKIFDIFYRGSRQSSDKGHGLGLAGVEAIVKSHGGRVAVSSQVGQGSTFTVILPKSPPQPAGRPRTSLHWEGPGGWSPPKGPGSWAAAAR